MSPKIAVVLLICSLVVLGLANAEVRVPLHSNHRTSIRINAGFGSNPLRRTVDNGSGQATTEGIAGEQIDDGDLNSNGSEYPDEATRKPLAANTRDNLHPTKF